ncbi:MAG: SURF1 family cytochrome oxidase biogenesis protein [Hyphomonadaceae bacterium]
MSFRPLPIMTICVVVSLGILAMLGSWQWQRYVEKSQAAVTEVEWETLFGSVVHDDVYFVSTIINGRSAWKHVGVYKDTERGDIVLATHFVSFQVNAPEPSPLSLETEFDSEDGVFVLPESPGVLTPKPSANTYFSYDVEAIRARLPDALAQRLRSEIYEPRLVNVRDDAGDLGEIENPFADPVLADPLPPARHLGYALTWWGMALALLIMYFVYHAGTGRLTLRDKP